MRTVIEGDENMAQQGSILTASASSNSNKNLLYIHGAPITRAKTKKMKEALTSLIEGIWREQDKEEVQDKLLLFQDDLKYVNMICTSPLQVQEV